MGTVTSIILFEPLALVSVGLMFIAGSRFVWCFGPLKTIIRVEAIAGTAAVQNYGVLIMMIRVWCPVRQLAGTCVT